MITTLLILFSVVACTNESPESPTLNEQFKRSLDILEADNIILKSDIHTMYTDFSRTFVMTVYHSESNLFSIGFEESVYTQEEIHQIISQLEVSLYYINSIVPDYEKVFIFAVDNTMGHTPIYTDDTIYLSKAHFDSNNYTQPIMKKTLNLNSTWASVGLYSILFNQAVDETHTLDQLAHHHDHSIVNLYDTRFIPDFNTEQEIQLANDLSVLLAQDIYEQYGIEGLLRDTNFYDKQIWLDKIGYYDEIYEVYDFIDESTHYSSSIDYPFEANYDRINFYVAPDYYNSSILIDTAKELEEFYMLSILNFNESINYIDSIRPEYRDNFDTTETFNLFIGGSLDYSRPYQGTNYNITENALINIPYQTFINSDLLKNQWTLFESNKSWAVYGLTNYIARVYSEHSYDNLAQLSLFRDQINKEITPALKKEINYLSTMGLDALTVDSKTFYMAHLDYNAHTTLLNPILDTADILNASTLADFFLEPDSDIPDGFELSFNQSMSLSMNIIKHHGLRTFESYVFGEMDFEESFGISYKDAKDMWIDEITPK